MSRDPARAEPQRRPAWLKVAPVTGEGYRTIKDLVARRHLHTVCEEARCPNRHECWGARTATLMLLGDRCTRSCAFCGVGKKRRPLPPDPEEPGRVAAAVRELGLRHAVLTSVTRDDLPDGGAAHWAATLRAIRAACPGTTVEALVPDFGGDADALARVLAEGPEVLSHNVETVPELYARARRDSDWERSLALLGRVARAARHRPVRVKSGMMLGLGESQEQLREAMARLVEAGVEILTLGQYLPPSRRHLPVARFVPPEAFDELKRLGEALGLRHVEAGPFVRSSYRAERHLRV
ncbi:MAG: lipoyl synthase [Candidatus Krumholzibacteriota bacterium]|nr:lipoyl synthase [Candidatus Krumholzibacteriota bacterium]